MINCKKCGMLNIDEKSKCFCNIKKFDENKLITKKEKKPINKVSDKKKTRIKEKWSELQHFIKVYIKKMHKNKNICQICQIEVKKDEVTPSSFPHILPKGKYPEYRYFENNIGLVCWIDHHNKFDEAINNLKQDIWLVKLEHIIKDWNEIDIENYIDY